MSVPYSQNKNSSGHNMDHNADHNAARDSACDSTYIDSLFNGHQVHRDVYTSQAVYQLEMKHLFANTWVFVGHESQTPNKGDYFTTQVGSQPVIQVRHSDDQIHVLHNRCPHKGTKIAID